MAVNNSSSHQVNPNTIDSAQIKHNSSFQQPKNSVPTNMTPNSMPKFRGEGAQMMNNKVSSQ